MGDSTLAVDDVTMEDLGSTDGNTGGYPTGYSAIARVYRDAIAHEARSGRVQRGTDGAAQLTSTSGFTGAGSSAVTPAVPRPLLRSYCKFSDGEIIFHNKFMIKGWGFGSKRVANTTDLGHFRSSSLLMLPVLNLALYLSPSEFELLPEMSKVVEVNVKICPIGSQVSFQTSASKPSHATSEHVVLLCYGSVNQSMPVIPVHLRGLEGSMTVDRVTPHTGFGSGTTSTIYSEIEKIWGSDKAGNDIACVDLATRHLNVYAAVACPLDAAGAGRWRLDRHVNTVTAAAAMGTNVIDWTYRPKCGYVKVQDPKLCKTQAGKIAYGTLRGGRESIVVAYDGTNVESTEASWKVPAKTDLDKIFSYSRVAVENADILRTRMSFDQEGLDPINLPLIGVAAIPSNVSGTSTDYVNVCTMFQLETKIVIRTPPRMTDYTTKAYNMKDNFIMINHGSAMETPEATRFYNCTNYGLGLDPGEGNAPKHGGSFFKAISGYSLRSRHRHGHERHNLSSDPYLTPSEVEARVQLQKGETDEQRKKRVEDAAAAGAGSSGASGRRRRADVDGDEGEEIPGLVGQLMGYQPGKKPKRFM